MNRPTGDASTSDRAVFVASARAFADLVGTVTADEWDRPALGEWTVRELTGHTLGTVTSVEAYAARRPDRVDLVDPVAYYQVVAAAGPDVHRVVAARGHDAGAALGDDPAGVVRDTVEASLARLGELPDDLALTTRAGGMRLDAYLASRLVELVVHSLDLADAVGRPSPQPLLAVRRAAEMLAAVPAGPKADDLLRALTGRRPLPVGYDVLG